MSDSTPPASTEKPSLLKGWAALIASIAALVTAIGALMKPPEEPAAKASYETLSKAVEDNSKQAAQNHDDIVALRNYLEGYVKGSVPAVAPSAAPSASSSAAVAQATPTGPSTKSLRPPAPLPSVGPRPPVWAAPDFSQVQKK